MEAISVLALIFVLSGSCQKLYDYLQTPKKSAADPHQFESYASCPLS